MTKLIIKFICIISVIVVSQACRKDPEFDYPEGKVGSSRIVYFPSVATKGEKTIIINQGTTFTDPGVTATLNGQPVTANSAVSVNTSVPGVYDLEYVATSPDGYTASDWRTVVVMSTSAQVTSNDFSGDYKRDNGVDVKWTKVGRGIYEVNNPGGAGVGVGFIVKLVNYEGNKIHIPKQLAFDPSIGGPNTVTSTSEVYNAGSAPITVKYALLAGGYGTQVRNFTKQ
jgi:hypothetical protein